MYDPSFFFERDQFVARIRESLEDFDNPLHDVFVDIIDFYDTCVQLARDYENCFDEAEKEKIADDYETVAKVLSKYLDVIKEAVDGKKTVKNYEHN
jgi:hypothetical protein